MSEINLDRQQEPRQSHLADDLGALSIGTVGVGVYLLTADTFPDSWPQAAEEFARGYTGFLAAGLYWVGLTVTRDWLANRRAARNSTPQELEVLNPIISLEGSMPPVRLPEAE